MITREEVQAQMDAEQAANSELAKLTSTSQVSFFRLLKNMWISLAMAIYERFDALQADVTTAIADGRTGSLAWYVQLIKAFQFGDSVSVYDGLRIGYAAIDLTKQIIAQAAITEQDSGRLLVKVAKNNPGVWPFQALNSDELTAFREYIRQIKYAGVGIDILSSAADELSMDVTIEYDRQMIDANGHYLGDTTRIPALEVIYSYARSLPFDSIFSWTELTALAKQKPGILDFQITRTAIRAAGSSAYQEFTRETSSRAGHISVVAANLTYV